MFNKELFWPLENLPKYLALFLLIVILIRFLSYDLITAQVESKNFHSNIPDIQIKQQWVDEETLTKAWPDSGIADVTQLDADLATVNADSLKVQDLQLRLLGIFQQESEWWAVVQITQGYENRIKAVKAGADVAGIMINSISINAVEVELSGNSHKLMLFKSPVRN